MPSFDGFQSNDFSGSIAGTKWRNRDSLAGVLALTLGNHAESKQRFQSWGIARQPELIFAPIKHFGGEASAEATRKRCKLLVKTEPSGLRYGFWVEKGFDTLKAPKTAADVMDNSWDWPRLAQLLQDPSRRSGFLVLLRNSGFHLHFEIKEGQETSLSTVLAQTDGTLTLATEGRTDPVEWNQICDLLTNAPGSSWVDFYLEKALSPAQAINRGSAIADDIVESFHQLMPIFDSVSGYAIVPRPTAAQLAAHLDSSLGLRFAPYQIACYVTALQTKGFVILSGMSGTGKTRLAQAFAALLRADDNGTNYLFLPVRPDWRDNKALVGYYNPILCHYESTELLRFVLDAQQEREAPRQASMADAVRVALKTPTDKSWLAGLKSMQQRLTGKQASQLTSEDLDLLWVQRYNGIASIGQAIATSLPHDERLLRATEIAMDKKRTPGERFADAVKVLAPPNHWARVWRTVAAFDIENVHTIVHGRKVRELLAFLGFQSPQDPRSLAERNQPGEIDKGIAFIMSEVDRLLPGLDTLERAIAPWLMWEYCNSGGNTAPQAQQAAAGAITPFFVLLDEMNLAHVEHYFADFLSVLESGRRENGFTREEIRLHSFEAPVQDAEGRAIPPALALPPNLYIVGTVNVDETTHAFSPKVLDRAFTIEFDAADLESYPASQGNAEAALSDDQRAALQTAFIRDGRFAVVDKAPTIMGSSAKDSGHMKSLRDLEQRLRPYELHFGYRVVDEILGYLANAEKYSWFSKDGGLDAAFDSAVLMKVLPKFHGPRARLKEPLHKILKWTGMPTPLDEATAKAANYQKAIEDVRQALASGPDYSYFRCPRTALKCLRMLYQLSVTGFASFS